MVKSEGSGPWFVGRGVEFGEFWGVPGERGSIEFLGMQARLFENSNWEMNDWFV
jgi:hypothetical protein